jgi:hypothetical protein
MSATFFFVRVESRFSLLQTCFHNQQPLLAANKKSGTDCQCSKSEAYIWLGIERHEYIVPLLISEIAEEGGFDSTISRGDIRRKFSWNTPS